MKMIYRVAILVLIVRITACSPVAKNPDGHTLGESATTTNTDAEELSPSGEEVALSLPEDSPTVSMQEVAPEQEISRLASAQDGVPEQDIPNMPIITEMHQGFTYRPGQVVAVLAEGFEEGDTLAVTLVHEDQGQIDTHFVSPVSSHGNIPIYLPVEIEEAEIYADGQYTFRVSGSDGTQKTYSFSLDFLNPADTAPFEGCGVYPQPVLDSIVFVWCTGYEPSAALVDIRGMVNGEELFSDVVDTIYSDGVALYVLDIFPDDPVGEWTLVIDQDELTIDVKGENHE